jgi:hypothetical protein
MGTDRTREIYRSLVYELSNWRDAQRELKAADQGALARLGRAATAWHTRVFGKGRQEYLAQLPAEEERPMSEPHPCSDETLPIRREVSGGLTVRNSRTHLSRIVNEGTLRHCEKFAQKLFLEL